MAINNKKKSYPGPGRLVVLLFLLMLSCGGVEKNFTGGTSFEEKLPDSYELMSTEDVLNSRTIFLHKTFPAYLLFLPGPLFLAAIIVLKKKKVLVFLLIFLFSFSIVITEEDNKTHIHKGISLYHSGSYDEALNHFISAGNTLTGNGPLMYNIALCHYKLGNTGYCIYYLKKAVKSGTVSSDARKLLTNLEKYFSLTSQVNTLPFFHDNIPFVLTVIFFNLSFIFFSIILMTKKGIFVIIFICCVAFTIISFSGFLFNKFHTDQKNGVIITESAVVKKIPLETARDWIQLKNGTIVRILEEAEEFILIQTGRGLKGWIRKGHLLEENDEY